MAAPGRVIYLDVDDEITSAAARIRSAEGTRVALVIPPGSRVATSRINFRLLAREAQAHGRRLAIVAPDAASRALAAAAGLEVFGSAAEYETAMAAPQRPGPAGGAAAVVAPAAGTPAAPSAETVTMTGIAGPGTPSLGRPAPGAPAAAGPPIPAGGPTGEPPPPDDLRPRSAVVGLRAVGGGTRRVFRARGLLVVGGIVLAAALVVGGVAAYVLLPAATIVVTPRLETIGPVSVTVTADPAATSVDTSAGVVPARTISLQVQASSTYKATGLRIDEAKATGTVTFTNCNFLGGVSIAAASRVSTSSGIGFTTNEALLVPAASFQPPSTLVCANRDVGVTAAQAGPASNVPAGSITVVPADVNPQAVSVSNAQPTSGGKRDTFPQVSQADVVAAQADLQKQLEAQFVAQLADPASVPAGLTLFPETARLGAATPTTDPASLVGKGVAQFTLGLSATGNATAVDEKPLATIAETRLRSSVQPGYVLVAGSVKTTVGKPTVAGATVTFPTSATARQVRQLDASALEAQVRGLSVDQAEQLLSQYGTVSISTWPDWVSTIPSYDFRIDLSVRSSAPVESPGADQSQAPSTSPGTAATPSPST